MRTSNQKCDMYVNKCEVFTANNIFAEDYSNTKESPVLPDGLYVVYSYGHHFPMYAYDYRLKVWIGNSDKYSVSTSKQQTQARPRFEIGKWLNTSDMQLLVDYTIKKAGV